MMLPINLVRGIEWLCDIVERAAKSPDNTYSERIIRTFPGKGVGEYSVQVRVGLPAQLPTEKRIHLG